MIFGQYLTIQAIVWSHFYSFRAPHPSLVYSKATMYIHFFCIFPLYMTAFISIQPNEYRILYRCLHVTVLLIYFPPSEAPVKKCKAKYLFFERKEGGIVTTSINKLETANLALLSPCQSYRYQVL